MRGIWKRFGNVQANAGIDIEFEPGRVHSVLGENGAGKSTLMNILGGLVRPERGEITVNGVHQRFRSPRDAMRVGIGMVHQNFRLIDRFTVAENVHCGWEATPAIAGARKLGRRTAELAERFDLDVDPDAQVLHLSVGGRQRVAILRALARGADLLILDEPTAVLTPQEADRLFESLRRMTEGGVSVVFISHKLREVLELSDKISVLRAGKRIATVERGECDAPALARMMVGRETPGLQRPPNPTARTGTPVIRLEAVSATNELGLPALHDVEMVVREGEILGVAGVAGNGQRELAEVVAGLRRPERGRVLVGERDLTRAGSRRFIGAGVGYIPEDRMTTGVVATEPIWCSAVLKSYHSAPVGRGPLLRRRYAKRFARQLIESAHLSTPDVDARVGGLSGGNVQRLIAARELSAATVALVAAYPSRGLDVGAIEKVHAAIEAACVQGLAVLLISEELEEILAICDRVVVMYEGRIVAERDAATADREELGLLMGGAGTADSATDPGESNAA
jgi:simple sugar transport system ATP-binding protein